MTRFLWLDFHVHVCHQCTPLEILTQGSDAAEMTQLLHRRLTQTPRYPAPPLASSSPILTASNALRHGLYCAASHTYGVVEM